MTAPPPPDAPPGAPPDTPPDPQRVPPPARQGGLDADLGQILRRLRCAGGRTQADLAAQIGVSAQQVQKYETGLNRLSVVRLIQFAAALGTPAAVILQDLEAGQAPVASPPPEWHDGSDGSGDGSGHGTA